MVHGYHQSYTSVHSLHRRPAKAGRHVLSQCLFTGDGFDELFRRLNTIRVSNRQRASMLVAAIAEDSDSAVE